MANIRGKYHTVTVTPTCFAGLNVNGDSIFLPTEIPNACYSGGTSLLKSIRLFDKDDLGVDMNLLFFETKPTVETLGAAGALFTIGGGGNNTDALVQRANPFGALLLDISEITTFDYTGSQIHFKNSIDMFVKSEPGEIDVDNDTGAYGSIYFMAFIVGTPTTAADSYTFQFVFES